MSRGGHLTGFICCVCHRPECSTEHWFRNCHPLRKFGRKLRSVSTIRLAVGSADCLRGPRLLRKRGQDSFKTSLGHLETEAIAFRHGTGSHIRQGVHGPLRRQLLACSSDMSQEGCSDLEKAIECLSHIPAWMLQAERVLLVSMSKERASHVKHEAAHAAAT